MIGISDRQWVTRAVIIVAFTVVIALFGSNSSFADGCGTYCKARQVRAICHNTLINQGIKGHHRDVAFGKCKVDPHTHKQIERIADDAGDIPE